MRRGKGWWLVRGGATLVGLSADDPRARLGRGGGALVGVEERGKVGGSSWILERGVVIGGPREQRGGEKERGKVRAMMMYMYMQPLNSPPSPTSTDGLLGGTKWKYTECYKMKVFLYLYVLFPLHTTLVSCPSSIPPSIATVPFHTTLNHELVLLQVFSSAFNVAQTFDYSAVVDERSLRTCSSWGCLWGIRVSAFSSGSTKTRREGGQGMSRN